MQSKDCFFVVFYSIYFYFCYGIIFVGDNYMDNKDNVKVLMTLFGSITGHMSVIEYIKDEEELPILESVKMAKDMRPSREDWEKLGFFFAEIPSDDVLCRAILPEGWKISKTEHPLWSEIFDENGRKRGSMFYKDAFCDRNAYMNLIPRYKVDYDFVDDVNTEVYFGNDQEKLFVAGQVSIPKDAPLEERMAKYTERDRLMYIARKYADENYPDWEDIHAYWNDEKGVSKKLSKEE